MKMNSKIRFLLMNGLRGTAWLLALLVVYFVIHEIIERNPQTWIDEFYSRPLLIYGIYLASEFFFGIIPPEMFMLWAINKGSSLHYLFNLLFFAGASYALGYVTFLIGSLFYKKNTFRKIKKKFLRNSWPQFKKYGLFLIIVAALTPIPWSAVCLIIGSAGYPSTRFLKFALFRVLRFAIYGYIIFQTHQFNIF